MKKSLAVSFLLLLIIYLSSSEQAFSTTLGIRNDKQPNNHRLDTIDRVSMMIYIKHGEDNSLDLTTHPFFKNQNLSFIFQSMTDLEAGMQLTGNGLFSWSPTIDQFNNLKEKSIEVPFMAKPSEGLSIVTGQIRLVAKGELIMKDTTTKAAPTIVPITVTSAEDSTEDQTAAPTIPITVTSAEDSTEDDTLEPLMLVLPTTDTWNQRKEGNAFSFQLKASGGSGNYTYEMLQPDDLLNSLDQHGNFSWTPDFDVVPGNQKHQSIPLKIHLFDDAGNSEIEDIQLIVENVNRPPSVSELPTFYVQYDRKNRYNLKTSGLVKDPDGDSIIIRPVLKELPQGMKISKSGMIDWKPSVSQFNFLRRNPLYLTFTVEDYPYGKKIIGQLKVEISQEDLPPQITVIPDSQFIEIEENEELNVKFFVTDPNGDDDLLRFDFVSGIHEIGEEALIDKDQGHYEFSWMPAYEFVKEQGAVEEFNITFFAIDKENNRTEKNLNVKVKDAEDLVGKDRILYDQYRTVLERAWDVVEQLNDKEKELNKEYKVAKKGKKNRAIGTAGLGILTGLSPVVFLENPTGQSVMAGIGGTATATIGTLEASNVIGESPSEVMKNLSYVSQKRNDLVIYGSVFASKYALPLNRRSNSFDGDLRSLTIHLNLRDMAQLELSASWENPKKANDKNIKKVFKDFNPDQRFAEYYP